MATYEDDDFLDGQEPEKDEARDVFEGSENGNGDDGEGDWFAFGESAKSSSSKPTLSPEEEAAELAHQLTLLVSRMDALVQDLEAMRKSMRKPLEGFRKFQRQVKAENEFVQQMAAGKVQVTRSRVLSSNVSLYESQVLVLKRERGILGMNQTFSLDGKPRAVKVDVVCGYGSKWVKVKAMSAKSIEDVFEGRGRYGERSVLEIAEELVRCAKQNIINFGPPTVEMVFADMEGLPEAIVDGLKQLGVSVTSTECGGEETVQDGRTKPVASSSKLVDSVELPGDGGGGGSEKPERISRGRKTVPIEVESTHPGGRIPLAPDEAADLLGEDDGSALDTIPHPNRRTLRTEFAPYSVDPAQITCVNLDITALVALSSDLTQGGCWHDFTGHPVLKAQAEDERVQPLLHGLEPFLKDKQWIICQLAFDEFKSILQTVGGPTEVVRGEALLKKCTVVPDQPSAIAMRLIESQRVRRRQKIVFGTGDTLHAATVTANVSFLRAAGDQGVHFAAFTHPSRALTEQKRLGIKSPYELAKAQRLALTPEKQQNQEQKPPGNNFSSNGQSASVSGISDNRFL